MSNQKLNVKTDKKTGKRRIFSQPEDRRETEQLKNLKEGK